MPDDPKSRALTIRFSEVEGAVMEAVAQKEGISAAAVVRRAVLAMGRDVLSEADWARAIQSARGDAEWLRWTPAWRRDPGGIHVTDAGLDALVARFDSLKAEVDELRRQVGTRGGKRGNKR